MNLKAKEDAVGRLDEILFSSESTIKYLTNSKTVNVQSVEFSPNGDLVALALKSGLLLITDFMTMGIVRVFCANEDFGLSANEDIDQFFPLWKLMNYFEEDFVFKTKPQETAKQCETFLENKYSQRRAKDPNAEIPKRINLHEVKGNTQSKISIASISWASNLPHIGVYFKEKKQDGQNINTCQNQFIVWNYINCTKIYSVDFSKVNVMNVALIGSQALVSGDQSMILDLLPNHPHIDQHRKTYLTVEETKQQVLQEGAQGIGKRKGSVLKAYNQIVISCGPSKPDHFLLVSNPQRNIYLVRKSKTQVGDPFINTQEFENVATCPIDQQANSFVNSAVFNGQCSKVILNCSDRVLRLYFVNYAQKQIQLLETFKDVINKDRIWLSAQFITLPAVSKVISESLSDKIVTQQTTMNILNATKYANETQELFVAASGLGDLNADCLHFYNAAGKFREIKKVELKEDGCSHMSTFSGAHFSIVIASSNGSLFVWSPKPAKIIQPLAPNFIEIDDNVMYVEREDEFESEESGDDIMEIDDGIKSLTELTTKQKKLSQTIALPEDIYQVHSEHLQVQVQFDDSFAVMARQHIQQLKEKFNGLLPQGQQLQRQT